MNPKILPNLDPDWVVGFTDAEGHFSVIKERKTIRCRFIISQDQRSLYVLHAIKAFFGVGHVHKAGGSMYAYTVGAVQELQAIILPFFNRYSLQSQKYYDWLVFNYAIQSKISLGNSFGISDVKLYQKTCQKDQSLPERPISSSWFVGFADGEGCFTVSIVKKAVSTQFVIGLHPRDESLCKRIQSFLGCGTVYRRKSGVVVFQVSKREDIISRILPLCYRSGAQHTSVLRWHALRTHKRRRFSLFCFAVFYIA
jgi:LAGLIDADG endonuclease